MMRRPLCRYDPAFETFPLRRVDRAYEVRKPRRKLTVQL